MKRKTLCALLVLLLCFTACGKDAPSPAETTAPPPLDADELLLEADVEHHNCEKDGHVFSRATCQAPAKCYYCGETTGEKDAHDFTHATCLQKRTCTVCGLEMGGYADHLFSEASCAGPASCAVCGQTTGSAKAHSFRAATCVSPSRCIVCMKTSGSALGHQWTGGNCTEPKVCTRCKRQLPAPGHKMTTGSCTEDAVCTVCGYTVKAEGHKFTDGVCTVCGQTKAEASRAEASRVEASLAAEASERMSETTEAPVDTETLLAFGADMEQLLQSAHDTADSAIESPSAERIDAVRSAVADLHDALDIIEQAKAFCRTDSRLSSLQTPLESIRKAIRKRAAISTVSDADAVKTATTVRADATAGLKAYQAYWKAVKAL